MNQKSNQLPTQLVTNQSKRPITELIGAIPDPNPQFGIRAINENSSSNKISNKQDRIKKADRIKNELYGLYCEFNYLKISKSNNDRLEQLIDIISELEWKLIIQLKR